ncbi:MAG: MFS transporter [Betaproteobacteria bacterium]|nr:MFS transporter [Betaproteobacteria bacterium]
MAETVSVPDSPRSEPLRARALAAYGLLALPLATAALPIYVHLPNLYGGVLGMNLALLGAVLLAARLADACIDPLLGALNDRMQKPRLLIALGMLLMTAGVAMAFNPPQQRELLGVWLAAALVPIYLGYSMASISYMAWGALLGDTPHQRTRVTAFREGLGLAGVVLASVLPGLLGAEIDQGLARFSLLLAALAVVCSAVTLLGAPRPPAGARQPFALRALFEPFANPRFTPLFAVFILNGIASALPATLVLFFVNDVLQLPRDGGVFLAVYFLAGAASLPLWVACARRFGKPRAWLAAMLGAVLAFAGALFLGPGDLAGFMAVCVLSGLALGADLALPPAMLADAIHEADDAPRAGAYFGLWNFATKLNLALAAGLALPLLQWFDYVPGDAGSVQPLQFAYCLLPCLFKLAAAALLWGRLQPRNRRGTSP